MVDFNKINPEDAQKIINALKDGNINQKEAKALGLTPQEAEALNKAFSSGQAEIGDFVLVNKGKSEDGKKQYSATLKKNQAPKQEEKSWWDKTCDFVKENAGLVAAATTTVVGGALCLTGVGGPIGALLIATGGALAISSCTFDEPVLPEEIKSENNTTINFFINVKVPGDETSEKYYEDFLNALKLLGEAQAKYIASLIETLINKIDSNGNNYTEQFQKIMGLLTTIISNSAGNGEKLSEILQILNNMQSQDTEFQTNVLNILSNVGAEYGDILSKILKATEGNSQKLTDITQLLAKMQNQDAEFQKNILNILNKVGTDYIEILNKILEATEGNSQKLTDITQLLAKMQNQDTLFQENILNAIDKLGINITTQLNHILEVINSSGDTGKSIEALLNKVLEKLDTMDKNQQANAQKIIEAINNIKVSGGNVDLSSIEKMLAELLQLTSKNNNLLENIDAKLDVLNVTANAILDKLDASNKDHKVIIDILNGLKETQCKGYDDTQLLKILELLSGKLDEILAAIKDHEVHVTVDEIKVTCTCNCGSNHEGILGELEDVLG